jgi:flagellin
MTRINTNVASLRGLRSLNRANDLLGTSLQRLSTGLKINSGKDDPAGLIAGETLRSQITSIEQSIKNSGRANNVISTADSALGEIGGLLNQVRGLVQEGLNTGALSQEEIQANQSQIDAALSAINRISANTTFAGEKLLDGSKAFTTAISSTDAGKLSDFQVNEALFGSSSTVAIDATVVSAAKKGEIHYSGGPLSSAATIEVSGSGGSQVLFLGGSSSVANMRDAINSVKDVTGVQASISNSAPGSLTVSNATAGSLAVQNSTAGSATLTTAGSININRNARAGFTQQASTQGNATLTFSDARATATVGDAATLGGQINVIMTNGSANDANSAVSSVDVDANGNYTVSIELADDGNGNSTATAANISAAIAAHAGASGLLSVSSTGTNTDTYGVAGSAQLSGGQDTTNNDVSFADVRPVNTRDDFKVAVAFVNPNATSSALSLSIATNEFGDQTINISLATDANGNITSTAAQVAALVDGDAQASLLVDATSSGTGAGVVQANAAVALSDTANSNLTFTDGRATDANAVFTNNLSVVFANGGASQTLGASFTANGDGGTLTVNLATDANGNITSTANDIKNLIANHSNAAISGNFILEASGDGTGTVQAFASTNLAGGANGANNDLSFTDARATNSQGEFATSISTQFLNTGANQALGATVSQDANGNQTITVNLATDANGNVTSTAGDIATYLSSSTDQGAVDARALVSVSASGNGTGVFAAKGIQSLTGGADGANNDITFTDARTGTNTQGISVAFANGGASQSLGVTVGLDGNGNHLITVNLATDANGNVTSTAADIESFITSNASAGAVAARALVSADASGTGAGVVAARTADSLTASSGSDVLVLSSTNYGSNEFVEVNVLNGSFATTLEDNTTAAKRNAGADIKVQINGQDAQGNGLKASVKTATLDASINFQAASNVANTTATISITGGGSLFQIGQEASVAGQIGLGIDAINTARLGGISGKLYELGTGGGKSLLDVGPQTPGSDLVDIVEQAINRVSTLRGRLGAIQKNVIETNVNSLGVALENITEARSSIVDADFATESANMTKAQILSQAGLSVLSIANQGPSQVLSLLG